MCRAGAARGGRVGGDGGRAGRGSGERGSGQGGVLVGRVVAGADRPVAAFECDASRLQRVCAACAGAPGGSGVWPALVGGRACGVHVGGVRGQRLLVG